MVYHIWLFIVSSLVNFSNFSVNRLIPCLLSYISEIRPAPINLCGSHKPAPISFLQPPVAQGKVFLQVNHSILPGRTTSKTPSHKHTAYINNSISLYLFLNSELQLEKSEAFNNQEMKAEVKRAFKNYFVTKCRQCGRCFKPYYKISMPFILLTILFQRIQWSGSTK